MIQLLQTTIALIFICLYLLKWYRRRRVNFTKTPLDAYIAALDSLSELGIRRHYGEEMSAFARRVNLSGFVYLSQKHQQGAFAMSENNVVLQIEIQKWTEFEDQIARTFPLWKRVVGALHPFSIFLSR